MVYAIRNGYCVVATGDLNGWISNRVRGRVTRAFEVDLKNENGGKIMVLC